MTNKENKVEEEKCDLTSYFTSVRIISQFLTELNPSMSKEHVEHNAKAVIARLAQENLLISEIET